jgi:predicted phage terminase large subunit-like protein
MNWQTRIKQLKNAVKNDLIDPVEAGILLKKLEFFIRCENVLSWGKYYFPDKFTSPFCNDLHDYLVSIRKHTKTNTLAPRGYAKTVIKCFLIPIYQALNEPEDFKHYLNIQATSTKAVNINLTIREEIEANELIKKDYGELVGNEKWTEKQFVLSNGVVFTSLGAGDSVRGINYRNQRPDYIVLDDLYDEDDIYSLERTAIHREDLMHTLPDDLWTSRKFSAILDNDKKKVLWPEVESYEKLMEDKKMMGSIIFQREMLNELHDDENAIIKTEYIVYYDKLPDKVKSYVWSWDTAIEESDQSDYTVGTLWAECADGYYLVDMYRKKVQFPELMRDIQNCFAMRKAKAVLVEKKASGHQIVQAFQKKTTIPIIQMVQGKNMGKKKSERLVLTSGLFEAKKVKFPSNKSWMIDVVDELVNFPNATHDDIVDSVTMYLERMMNKKSFSYAIIE